MKPTLVADLDAQIKAKEAELGGVNNKRRESVALVARMRNGLRQILIAGPTKREESDKRRTELLARRRS